jgi:GNAT superfamily N-acetyltransferase
VDIRILTQADGPAAVSVINAAAEWYAEFLGELDEPEMELDEWLAEGLRITWFGASDGNDLVGVAGLEYVDDVALLRHAYVLPEHQMRGVGLALAAHLEAQVEGVARVIVGTYRANYKARGVLEKRGFVESTGSEAVLRRYYDIPEDRLQLSLTYEKSI